MHTTLARALNLLNIGDISIVDDQGSVINKVTAEQHATALFSYLNLAGYLSIDLLKKAVTYLSAAKSFSCSNEIVIDHLKYVCDKAHQNSLFNTDWFLDNFCQPNYFEVDDIIDLIVFLQQTAFDRAFGSERDKLQVKPWLEQHSDKFKQLATNLGIVTPLPPMHETYCGTAVMGAASMRVATRIQYLNSLKQDCGKVWACSGNRALSKGLDEEKVMIEVAQALKKPIVFVEKGNGTAKRTFFEGITETMMVNYLLQKICARKEIQVLDSGIETGHWRATTAQSAKDIARVLIQEIQDESVCSDKKGIYHFMVIAEQPYAGRMAKQIQRAFNAEISEKRMPDVKVVVHGTGPGISEEQLGDINVLIRMNSELGSLMAERYNDARLSLQKNSNIALRDPKILMFAERDTKYCELKLQHQQDSSNTILLKQ